MTISNTSRKHILLKVNIIKGKLEIKVVLPFVHTTLCVVMYASSI